MSLYRATIVPSTLMIAGVHQKTSRIITARYSLTDYQNCLNKLKISLPEAITERQLTFFLVTTKGGSSLIPESLYMGTVFTSLISNDEYLVTKAMLDHTGSDPFIPCFSISRRYKYDRPMYSTDLVYGFDPREEDFLGNKGFGFRVDTFNPSSPFPILVQQKRPPQHYWDIDWKITIQTALVRSFIASNPRG